MNEDVISHFLLNMGIFQGHVSFQGSSSNISLSKDV